MQFHFKRFATLCSRFSVAFQSFCSRSAFDLQLLWDAIAICNYLALLCNRFAPGFSIQMQAQEPPLSNDIDAFALHNTHNITGS
jgi:uncharacterized protein YjaG (DUF416 family)